MSKEYLDWVNWMKSDHSDVLPLTNAQHYFVEWALKPENMKYIGQIGEVTSLFKAVREYSKR